MATVDFRGEPLAHQLHCSRRPCPCHLGLPLCAASPAPLTVNVVVVNVVVVAAAAVLVGLDFAASAGQFTDVPSCVFFVCWLVLLWLLLVL